MFMNLRKTCVFNVDTNCHLSYRNESSLLSGQISTDTHETILISILDTRAGGPCSRLTENVREQGPCWQKYCTTMLLSTRPGCAGLIRAPVLSHYPLSRPVITGDVYRLFTGRVHRRWTLSVNTGLCAEHFVRSKHCFVSLRRLYR